MKRLPINLFLTICSLIILLASCQVKTPKEIIQPDEMEALLYDYHIVQAMGNELNNVRDYHLKLYHEYVFKKHGVTKALFDSSLVWYTRHPSHLTQMYANLQERLDLEVAAMQDEKSNTKAEALIAKELTADTLDLWTGMTVDELTSAPYKNRLLFAFNSDSAFVAGDSLVLNIGARFFSKKESAQHVYAAIIVTYNDDTTKSVAANINSSGTYTLQIARDYDRKISEVNGFIYYNDNDESAKSGVILSGLSLLRIHPQMEEESEE